MSTPQQFNVGDTVGDYLILEELGTGGGGQVFKVEHIITRRREALKVLAGTTPSAREGFLRFLREIRLQAGLEHPNIAEVHNAFWTGEDLVMVMELLEGSVLERVLTERRVPLEEGIAIARQVLCALAHAHGQGVIHRDVSPSNIILTAGNKVKLTDFGLATMAEDMRVTQNGAFLGSFHYMSPEQVRGTGPWDARTDVYSCGAVLYEILTGRKPFEYDNAFALMRAHVEEQPHPPVSIDPNIPPALNSIVLRALAKDPAGRFPTAASFRDALDALDPFTLCLATAGISEAGEEPAPAEDPPAGARQPAPESRPAEGLRLVPRLTQQQWQYAGGAALATLMVLGAAFASFRLPPAAVLPPPPTRVDPVQPVAVPGPPPAATETPAVLPLIVPRSPAPAPLPQRPSVAVPRRISPVDPPPLPPAVVHNASPAEPAPAEPVAAASPTPDPTPASAEPLHSAQPVPEPTAASQVEAPAAGVKPEARPKGIRGFFGRMRALNPVRRKPDKDADKTGATSEAQGASKP